MVVAVVGLGKLGAPLAAVLASKGYDVLGVDVNSEAVQLVNEGREPVSGRRVGENMGLCYSPEFIALGNVIRDMLEPDMVLIGESDPRAGDAVERLYAGVCENDAPFRRMSLVNAELTKIAVNTYVTMKISYANALADMCERLPGAEVDAVTD